MCATYSTVDITKVKRRIRQNLGYVRKLPSVDLILCDVDIFELR